MLLSTQDCTQDMAMTPFPFLLLMTLLTFPLFLILWFKAAFLACKMDKYLSDYLRSDTGQQLLDKLFDMTLFRFMMFLHIWLNIVIPLLLLLFLLRMIFSLILKMSKWLVKILPSKSKFLDRLHKIIRKSMKRLKNIKKFKDSAMALLSLAASSIPPIGPYCKSLGFTTPGVLKPRLSKALKRLSLSSKNILTGVELFLFITLVILMIILLLNMILWMRMNGYIT